MRTSPWSQEWDRQNVRLPANDHVFTAPCQVQSRASLGSERQQSVGEFLLDGCQQLGQRAVWGLDPSHCIVDPAVATIAQRGGHRRDPAHEAGGPQRQTAHGPREGRGRRLK